MYKHNILCGSYNETNYAGGLMHQDIALNANLTFIFCIQNTQREDLFYTHTLIIMNLF